MFPDPCGAQLADAVRKGADPRTVVPSAYAVVHGGTRPLPVQGSLFSGSVGPTVGIAAAAIPPGQMRTATVGAIRAAGGTVEWSAEITRHATVNEQHVNITEGDASSLSPLQRNPVPRHLRIDGDKP